MQYKNLYVPKIFFIGQTVAIKVLCLILIEIVFNRRSIILIYSNINIYIYKYVYYFFQLCIKHFCVF